MKNIIKIAVLVIIVFSFVLVMPAEGRRGPVRIQNKVPVNPASIVMLKGKVQAVMTTIPVVGGNVSQTPHALIKVKIFVKETGSEYIVQLAPGNFMSLQGLVVNRDDIVNVKAFRTPDSPELKSMTFEKSGRVFILRDEFGRGLWEKNDIRPGRDKRIK